MNPLVFDLSQLRSSREFIEAKRHPSGPALVLLVLVGLMALGAWCTWGEVEVVVKASAQIRPLENISIVKNVYQGTVDLSWVVPGSLVRKGDRLWHIDSRLIDIELETIRPQQARLKRRLDSLVGLKNSVVQKTLVSSRLDQETATRWRSFVFDDQRHRLAKLKVEDALIKEKSKPSSMSTGQAIKELDLEVDFSQATWDSWYGQTLVQLEGDIRTVTVDLENLDARIRTLDRQKTDTLVVSPLDGVVEESRKINPGDLLQASEEVVKVVPEKGSRLRIEIQLAAKDRAQVRIGQKIRMKFEALSPSEYGYLDGITTIVPPDSLTDSQGKVYFKVIGEMEKTELTSKAGAVVAIQPGMTTETRIIIKKSPIWKLILEVMDIFA